MPPVADRKESVWGEAMKAAWLANKKAGKKPDSWRSLYAALAAQSGQTVDTWKRNISRYRPAGAASPGEPIAQAIADALGVPRESLPKPEQVTLALLAFRLEELAAKVELLATNAELHSVTATLVGAIARGPMRGSSEAPAASATAEQRTAQ